MIRVCLSTASHPVLERRLPLEGLPMVDQVTQVALFVAQIALKSVVSFKLFSPLLRNITSALVWFVKG